MISEKNNNFLLSLFNNSNSSLIFELRRRLMIINNKKGKKFFARIDKRSKRKDEKGKLIDTLLLKNVYDENYTFVTDHFWLDYDERFSYFQRNDVIFFTADVVSYTKNNKKDDYKLDNLRDIHHVKFY